MEVISFEHLKELATSENDDMKHFYILLSAGIAKSSKRIKYHKPSDIFDIIHEIDESYQEISSLELSNDLIFKQAIDNHCLFMSTIN